MLRPWVRLSYDTFWAERAAAIEQVWGGRALRPHCLTFKIITKLIGGGGPKIGSLGNYSLLLDGLIG